MEITLKKPICSTIKLDEDDKEAGYDLDTIPLVTAELTVTVKAAEMHEDADLPKKTYVNFKFTKGNKPVFRNFMKGCFKKLEMFMLPGTSIPVHKQKE